MQNPEQPPVPKPPVQPSPRPSFISRVASGTKKGVELLSNLTRMVFQFILFIFLIIFVIGLVAGGENDPTLSNKLYGDGPEKIAVVNLSGLIVDIASENPFDALESVQVITPRKLMKQFEMIKKDASVKAVVLRINSPGGSVTASDEIYYMIQRFRAETGLPVIASYGEVAASGGYYISLAADTIIADPTSLTGSIGVIASLINVKDLADRYGIKEVTITAGKNKNFMSPLQVPEASQTAILQTIVDEAYDQFIARINESREVPESTLTALADGRPLTGKQAHEAKLADQTGNFYYAIEYVRSQVGFPNAEIVEYSSGGFFESLFGAVMKPFANLNPLASITTPLSLLSGKPAYLYSPM